MNDVLSTVFAAAALAVYCSAWATKGERREILLAVAFGLEGAALAFFPRA